jgi:thiamine kinase-like enzyme
MIEKVLAEYNLNKEELVLESINNGLINQTWHIRGADKDYILQKINTNIFKKPDIIANNIRLIADYLMQKNPEYLFVAPIKTLLNKEMSYLEQNGHFRLFPFIQNSHSINAVQNTKQAYEAAKAFGKFTKLLADFPAEKLGTPLADFHNLSLRYHQFELSLESGNQVRIDQSTELISFIKSQRELVDIYEVILKNSAFKLRVTHHDTKISNILFNKVEEGLCVIDLDTVMPGYYISDVGDMIRTYTSLANEEEKDFSKINLRAEYFTAIQSGYLSEMGDVLSEEEKKYFTYAGKFMIYMQAIRFLTDHINNDVYYGARYENHNFVRAGNQCVLLQQLIAMEATFL